MNHLDYQNRKYTVIPYDPEWQKRFNTTSDELSKIFSNKALAIEHIGSTAIPGLAGKPTIDALVIVEGIAVADSFTPAMEAAGYSALGEYVKPGSRLFIKEQDNVRIANIHIFEKNHPHVAEMLKFREYLTSHADDRQAYSDLKVKLSKEYPDDYGLYRKYKDEYLEILKGKIKASGS